MARRLSGDTPEDERLWFTYYHAASADLVRRHPGWEPAYVKASTDPNMMPDEEMLAAIRSIVFSAFVLEYRMKRACEVLGVKLRKKTMLNDLIDHFWDRVSGQTRLDLGGPCAEPADWRTVKPHLKHLCELRNSVAHGNRATLVAKLIPTPEEAAKTAYNHLMDALRIMNVGIGYVTAGSDPVAYFNSLKLR